MMRRYKTLIVLPHLVCGGTERTAAELANFMSGKGQDVTVLLMYKKEIFYKLSPEIRLIQPDDIRKTIGKILYIPYLLYYLRQNIRKERPDNVFALGYMAFTLFATLGLRTRVVISGRSSPGRIRFPGSKAMNMTYKVSHYLLRKRVDGIIAQTSYAADEYKKRYSCPVVVIPNFLREIKEYRQERRNQIITVGRCAYEKGQHLLIEAFSKTDAGDWKLVIVGDGPRRKNLEGIVSKLNIGGRVIFTGFQEDVDFFLSQSKIFVLPSLIEGFPNALIEAMANSLAPVSFNCEAGPSEIIEHGRNGFLVEVGNVESLAQYLSGLIHDERLLNSIASEAGKVKSQYSIDVIAEKYIDFLLKN
jgi:GalNAc-alpha-(1->4)-GalNAc-alpha-(1->3)-diNAcBac-PP-undecaprenol alpha-1,4-N-acetyl-D-galactosaminyltransferase